MTHTSDAKHAALLTQTGQVSGATDDLEQLYLETQTGLTGHVNDLWYALFVQNGATSGDWNDAAYEFLLTLGAPAGHIDDMWYYFWDTLGGAIGPTVVIQGNGDTGQCTYELPATTECFATQTFTANDTNFTNPANQWVWSIESGDAEITAGAGTKTVTVRTPSVLTGESSTNVTFELKVIATDTVSTDSATRTTSFTHQHIDETPAPLFIGPNINTTELVQNAAMTPFDVSPRFSGYITAYSLVGTWPAGLSVDNAGVLTGTPTDPLGDYTNLQFRATGPTGSADSNLFTVEIIAGAVAPVFIGPNVLDQVLEVNVPYTLDLRPLFTGTAPTYSVTTGVLPTGLTLDPSGIISGTPTVVDENDNIVVTATNGAGSDTTNTFNMLTDAAPVFSGTIPDQTWTLNTAITPLDTSTYFANNTSVTYSSGGTLPAGVSLDTNTGIISGTPTVETTGSFTVTATNAFGADTSNSVAYTVQDVALPSFEALVPDPTTYEMLGVKTGTGDLTTTHTADLYAPDVDGVYRNFAANEPVWSGGRVVSNLFYSSELFSVVSVWGFNQGGFVQYTNIDGVDCSEIQFNADPLAAVYQSGPNLIETMSAAQYIITARVRSKTGSINLRFSIEADAGTWTPDIPVDENWVTISAVLQGSTGSTFCSIRNGSGGAATDFYCQYMQIERSNGSAPSEFIPHGTSLPNSRNLIDQTEAQWTKTGCTLTEQTGYLEMTNTTSSNQNCLYDPIVLGVSRVKFTCEAYAPSTNTTPNAARISLGGTTLNTVAVTAEDEWQTLEIEVIQGAKGVAAPVELYLQCASSGAWGDAGDVARFRNIVFHDIETGQKTFANQNGNTVLNNVVTEAVGAPLAEAPYLQYYPAAQNDLTYSRDLTNAAWSPVGATTSYDQVGLTGEPSTASIATDNSAAAAQYIRQQSLAVVSGQPFVVKYWIKKDADTTTFPLLGFVGTGISNCYFQLNTSTGAVIADGGGNAGTAEVVDDGDWWLVLIARDNTHTGTSISDLYVWPARDTVWGGSGNVAAQRSIIVGNVELHTNKTIAEVRGLGPIFTTTAAVATDVTAYEMDVANAADDDTAWYFEVGPYTATENRSLITRNTFVTNQGLYSSSLNNRIGYRQTTSITSLDNARTLDVAYKYSAIASEGLANLRTEAVTWIVDAAWDNTPWWTGMYLGNASGVATGTAPIQLRNIQRYDITSLQQGKDIIDGLMTP